MYINLYKYSAASQKCFFFFFGGGGVQIFQTFCWFQTKQFTRLLEFIKLYKQNTLDNFVFIIYQNCILALYNKHCMDATFHLSVNTLSINFIIIQS